MPKQLEKILVADQDADVLNLIAQEVLIPMGYTVIVAQDGTAALQLSLKNQPDIIITAVDLPGLSGRDLLAALRSQGFQNAIIATGPKGSDAHMLQAFRLGAKDYLTKPIREAELVSTVERALEDVRLRRDREQLAQKLSAANQQLERRLKELTTLYGIGKAVTAITEVNPLLARLMDGALFVTEAELGWLLLAEGKTLILRAAKNLPTLGGAKLGQAWDDGLSTLLMLSGEGILIAGEPLAKMRAGQVARAAVAVPIKAKNEVIGVLVTGNKTGKAFTDRDQAMLSAVADYASIALVNAHLFGEMESRVAAMQKNQEAATKTSQQSNDMALRVGRELRQPLLQAREAVSAAATAGPINARQSDLMRSALENLAQAQGRVDDLTLLSEVNSRPTQRPIEVGDLIRQAITRQAAEAKTRGVTLTAQVATSPLRLSGDWHQLSRVLDNLIENATHFSPNGGEVVVSAAETPDGKVRITVKDNGLGIAPEHHARVFERFYQVDAARKFGGLGLGLAVVRHVVEAHGGKVTLNSLPGRGTEVSFALVKV